MIKAKKQEKTFAIYIFSRSLVCKGVRSKKKHITNNNEDPIRKLINWGKGDGSVEKGMQHALGKQINVFLKTENDQRRHAGVE